MNAFDLILNKTVYEASLKLGGQCGNFSESPAGKAAKKAFKLYLQRIYINTKPNSKEGLMLHKILTELEQ